MADAKRGLFGPQANREEYLRRYLHALPEMAPREIHDAIRARGYVGQDTAVKAVSLWSFRHLSRLRKIYLRGIPREELPAKTNMLFVGPTGCGKTYLVELLFREVLRLPTVVTDMTSYSETGYVGQDVATILTRLLYAAELDAALASVGVVCLDEFDKIASGQNNAVFAGAGTTKDVSGLGVQRELLKMLESAEIAVPAEITHSEYAPKTMIPTRDIVFVACGAFSGLKGVIQNREERIGFGREIGSARQEAIAVSYSAEEMELVRNFHNYGFLPELIGRFKRIVPFQALNGDQLKSILVESVLGAYENEFRLDGIGLEVRQEVLDLIVSRSLRMEAGARGIDTTFIRYLEDAAYEAFSRPGATRVTLYLDGDRVAFSVA